MLFKPWRRCSVTSNRMFHPDWGGVKLKRTFITLFARLKRSSVSSRRQMETFKGSLFLLNLSKTFIQTWNNGNIEVSSSSFLTSSRLCGGYKQAVNMVAQFLFLCCIGCSLCFPAGLPLCRQSEGHNCWTSGPEDRTKRVSELFSTQRESKELQRLFRFCLYSPFGSEHRNHCSSSGKNNYIWNKV